MTALIAGAAADGPVSLLLPTRQDELFRWALAVGFRVVKPMNYMVIGHPEPAGAWIRRSSTEDGPPQRERARLGTCVGTVWKTRSGCDCSSRYLQASAL